MTVTADIAADAHLDMSVLGTTIIAKPVFDRLRLDYDILDKIPLEDVANYALGGKTVTIFRRIYFDCDCPVFNTRFQIDSIDLPNKSGAIGIGATVKQIK